jgi:hypothetical protein
MGWQRHRSDFAVVNWQLMDPIGPALLACQLGISATIVHKQLKCPIFLARYRDQQTHNVPIGPASEKACSLGTLLYPQKRYCEQKKKFTKDDIFSARSHSLAITGVTASLVSGCKQHLLK